MGEMPKIYTAICLGLVLCFAYASARGIVYSSVLSGSGTAVKAESRYHK